MAGICKVKIIETAAELKSLLSQQKTVCGYERVQALYLLKIGRIETVKDLATAIGRDRTTVQRWLRTYRQEGIEALLKINRRGGSKSRLPEWAVMALEQRLSDPQGFSSYQEVRSWLQSTLGIEVSYKVVYLTVHYKLKAKLKVARPESTKKKPS